MVVVKSPIHAAEHVSHMIGAGSVSVRITNQESKGDSWPSPVERDVQWLASPRHTTRGVPSWLC